MKTYGKYQVIADSPVPKSSYGKYQYIPDDVYKKEPEETTFIGDVLAGIPKAALWAATSPLDLPRAFVSPLEKEWGPIGKGLASLLRQIPSGQEAREATVKYLPFLPKALAQETGDLAETIGTYAPLFMGPGGIAAKAAQGLGALGGMKLGGELAGQLGQQVGLPETGRTLGELAGAGAGFKGVRKLAPYIAELPTSSIPRLASEETTKIRESLAKKEPGLKEYESRKYKQAEQALAKIPGKDISVEAKPLRDFLTKFKDKLPASLEDADMKRLTGASARLENRIAEGKISVGNLISEKQALNDIIYDHRTPNIVKNYLGKMRNAIASTISSASKEYPEFGNAWKKAESAHKQLKQLQKEQGPLSKKLSAQDKFAKELSASPLGSENIFSAFGTAGKPAKFAWNLLKFSFVEPKRQRQAIERTMKEQPHLYKQWQSAVKKAAKGSPGDAVNLLNYIYANISKPEQEESIEQ